MILTLYLTKASLNLKRELATVMTAGASTNVAASSMPEEVVSFGNQIGYPQVRDELSWCLVIQVDYLPSQMGSIDRFACSSNVRRQYPKLLPWNCCSRQPSADDDAKNGLGVAHRNRKATVGQVQARDMFGLTRDKCFFSVNLIIKGMLITQSFLLQFIVL